MSVAGLVLSSSLFATAIPALDQSITKLVHKLEGSKRTNTSVSEASAFEGQVYGNYCGQHWCAGKNVEEGLCPFDKPSINDFDDCCRAHDRCCPTEGAADNHCNREIVACMDNSKPWWVDIAQRTAIVEVMRVNRDLGETPGQGFCK